MISYSAFFYILVLKFYSLNEASSSSSHGSVSDLIPTHSNQLPVITHHDVMYWNITTTDPHISLMHTHRPENHKHKHIQDGHSLNHHIPGSGSGLPLVRTHKDFGQNLFWTCVCVCGVSKLYIWSRNHCIARELHHLYLRGKLALKS